MYVLKVVIMKNEPNAVAKLTRDPNLFETRAEAMKAKNFFDTDIKLHKEFIGFSQVVEMFEEEK